MTTQQISLLAPGVHLRRPVPGRGWGLANGGLVVCPSGAAAWIDAPYDLRLGRDFLAQCRPLLPAGTAIDSVIVTHANGDHLWGAAAVPDAQVIATTQALDHLDYDPSPEAMQGLVHGGGDSVLARYLERNFGRFDWSSAAPVVPDRTFTGDLDLSVGEIPVQLRPVGPAHTDGDLIVHLPDQSVVFAGDVIFSSTEEEAGDFPVHWAGPLSGVVAACQAVLDTGARIIVPGHGPVLDRSGVERHMAFLADLAERVGALHASGLGALDAARQLAGSDFHPELGLRERLVVTVATEYRHLDGKPAGSSVLEIVGQMAALAAELDV